MKHRPRRKLWDSPTLHHPADSACRRHRRGPASPVAQRARPELGPTRRPPPHKAPETPRPPWRWGNGADRSGRSELRGAPRSAPRLAPRSAPRPAPRLSQLTRRIRRPSAPALVAPLVQSRQLPTEPGRRTGAPTDAHAARRTSPHPLVPLNPRRNGVGLQPGRRKSSRTPRDRKVSGNRPARDGHGLAVASVRTADARSIRHSLPRSDHQADAGSPPQSNPAHRQWHSRWSDRDSVAIAQLARELPPAAALHGDHSPQPRQRDHDLISQHYCYLISRTCPGRVGFALRRALRARSRHSRSACSGAGSGGSLRVSRLGSLCGDFGRQGNHNPPHEQPGGGHSAENAGGSQLAWR